MRFIILSIIILISSSVSGQAIEVGERPKSVINRFRVGIGFSGNYCYRTLNNNDGSSQSDVIIELNNKNQNPKFGYTSGFVIDYKLSPSIFIESGVQFSNTGYASKKSDLYFGDQIDPRGGYVYNPGTDPAPESIKFIYSYKYLDVPLKAVFAFGNKRISYMVGMGVTSSVLLKATTTTVLKYGNGDRERKRQEQTYDFNNFNLSPELSAGLNYAINKNLCLRIEPTFRYGLIQITDTPVTANLWSAGLSVSCLYELK